MAKEQEVISIREYAKRLNISDKSIRNAISDGKIKKGVKYESKLIKGKIVQIPQIIVSIANREYGDSKNQVKQQAGVSKTKVAEKLEKKVKSVVKKDDNKKSASPQEQLAKTIDNLDIETIYEGDLLEKLSVDEATPYAEILRRNELLVFIMNKTKAAKEKGILVEKEKIDKTLFEMGNLLKTTILNVPARCTALMLGSGNETDAMNILTLELTQALESISNLKNGRNTPDVIPE